MKERLSTITNLPIAGPRASESYGFDSPRRTDESRRGRNVLREVLFSAVFFSALLTFGAGMMGSRYLSDEAWSRTARARDLVEQTMDALAAYSFETVADMDGSSIHDHPAPEESDYQVDLAVSPTANGVLQIKAVLRDARTRREVSRFVTWRGRG